MIGGQTCLSKRAGQEQVAGTLQNYFSGNRSVYPARPVSDISTFPFLPPLQKSKHKKILHPSLVLKLSFVGTIEIKKTTVDSYTRAANTWMRFASTNKIFTWGKEWEHGFDSFFPCNDSQPLCAKVDYVSWRFMVERARSQDPGERERQRERGWGGERDGGSGGKGETDRVRGRERQRARRVNGASHWVLCNMFVVVSVVKSLTWPGKTAKTNQWPALLPFYLHPCILLFYN